MDKKKLCTRCESVGRKPKEGTHLALGPNGVTSLVCDECWKEIDLYIEDRCNCNYEIEEDEESP